MFSQAPDCTATEQREVRIFLCPNTSRVTGGRMAQTLNERHGEQAFLREAFYACTRATVTQAKGCIIGHTGLEVVGSRA